MPLFPSLVGGVEIRERRPRRNGEPVYKRLDFVRSKSTKTDFELVRTVYTREHASRMGEMAQDEEGYENGGGSTRLSFEQLEHAQRERIRSHQELIRQEQRMACERQLRQQHAEQQAEQERLWRQQMTFHRFQQQQAEQAEQAERVRQGLHLAVPPLNSAQYPGVGVEYRQLLENRMPSTMTDLVEEFNRSDSDPSIVKVVTAKLGKSKRIQRERGSQSRVCQDDIYSSDSDDVLNDRSRCLK